MKGNCQNFLKYINNSTQGSKYQQGFGGGGLNKEKRTMSCIAYHKSTVEIRKSFFYICRNEEQ